MFEVSQITWNRAGVGVSIGGGSTGMHFFAGLFAAFATMSGTTISCGSALAGTDLVDVIVVRSMIKPGQAGRAIGHR